MSGDARPSPPRKGTISLTDSLGKESGSISSLTIVGEDRTSAGRRDRRGAWSGPSPVFFKLTAVKARFG